MLPRRKPAPAPGPLLALARKPTQLSKVPASRQTVESGKTAEKVIKNIWIRLKPARGKGKTLGGLLIVKANIRLLDAFACSSFLLLCGDSYLINTLILKNIQYYFQGVQFQR